MAVTFTPATLTPRAPRKLRLAIAAGGADTGNYTQAQLIAACVPGPLRTFLSRVPVATGGAASPEWDALNRSGALLLVYSALGNNPVPLTNVAFYDTGGGGAENCLTVVCAGALSATLELTLLHSLFR